MSHLAEREEKNCLNCNAQVNGKFCHICGQENIEPKESFWRLVSHFIIDITHYDGKFFRSMRLLIRKPGYLSHQYMEGRRASFLNPVRMYLFSSAFFFLVFFTIFNVDKIKNGTYKLPFKGKTIENIFSFDPEYLANFLHRLPLLLFISLPLFALILKFLYIRRKKFYYSDHAIFSIHLYIFFFISMLVIFGLIMLYEQLHWGVITVLEYLIVIALFLYMYKAMRNFYDQRRIKTIVKFLLLIILSYLLLILLFAVFLSIVLAFNSN